MLDILEHDLIGKPVSTFPDHAGYSWRMIFSENRFLLSRIMLDIPGA